LKDVEKLYSEKVAQQRKAQSDHLSFLYKRDDLGG